MAFASSRVVPSGSRKRTTAVIITTSLRKSGPAVPDRYVLTFNIARFLQAGTKCIHHGPVSMERCGVEKPDHWHRRLLLPRPEVSTTRSISTADVLSSVDQLGQFLSGIEHTCFYSRGWHVENLRYFID